MAAKSRVTPARTSATWRTSIGGAVARQAAGHVQQAAHVAGEQEFGLGRFDVGGFFRHHARRDVGIFDAERAAEAAADFRLGHLGEGEAGDGAEQSAGLGFDAEFAQAGAGIVIGGGDRQRRRGGGEFHDVDQEGGQLVGFRGELVGLGAQVGVVVEQMRHVFGEHAAAGAGRDHDVVIGGEGGDEAGGEVARGGAVAGIVGGLAAAGLGARHLHGAPRRLQQARCWRSRRWGGADRRGR